MIRKTKTKRAVKKAARVLKKRPTVGARIIEGLEQAIAWTRGENENVRWCMCPRSMYARSGRRWD